MKTLEIRNGDLVIGSGGYSTISGTNKVFQDLGIWVREAIGTDRFHPRWGTVLAEYLGNPVGRETEMLVTSEINRLIQNYIVMQSRQIEHDAAEGRAPRYQPEEIVIGADDVKIQQRFDRLNVRVLLRTAAGETVEVLRTVGL